MARMLQALKNLEARAKPPAPPRASLLSHLAEAKPHTPPAPAVKPLAPPLVPTPAPPPAPVPPPAPAPAIEMLAPLPPQFTAPAAIVVQTAEQFTGAALDPVIINTELPPPEPPRPLPPPLPFTPSRPPTPPPTAAERAVRHTLGEPHRRQPLADLAARLRQDASKSGSRTLLLAGIGPQSATHETALHVASLLAEEGGQVLLIDGDLVRRQLSTDLDDLQEAGLSNLSSETEADELIQLTAQAGLVFLPAGTERFANVEGAAGALGRTLGQLAAHFDLILIDGGRTGDPGLPALARLADATYIIVQLGTIEASQAQQALRDLRAGGARVLGCIATGGEASS